MIHKKVQPASAGHKTVPTTRFLSKRVKTWLLLLVLPLTWAGPKSFLRPLLPDEHLSWPTLLPWCQLQAQKLPARTRLHTDLIFLSRSLPLTLMLFLLTFFRLLATTKILTEKATRTHNPATKKPTHGSIDLGTWHTFFETPSQKRSKHLSTTDFRQKAVT